MQMRPDRFEVGTLSQDGRRYSVVAVTPSLAEAEAMANSPSGQFYLYDRSSDIFLRTPGGEEAAS